MQKDFDTWNNLKKEIDASEQNLFFKEGEVWWVNLGLNIGFEANGKGYDSIRPVIILKKYNKNTFIALPLTTSPKTNKYRLSVGIINKKNSYANFSQLRTLDNRRLINKIGEINIGLFLEIRRKASRLNFD